MIIKNNTSSLGELELGSYQEWNFWKPKNNLTNKIKELWIFHLFVHFFTTSQSKVSYLKNQQQYVTHK